MAFLDLSITEVKDKLKEGVVRIAKILCGITASVSILFGQVACSDLNLTLALHASMYPR